MRDTGYHVEYWHPEQGKRIPGRRYYDWLIPGAVLNQQQAAPIKLPAPGQVQHKGYAVIRMVIITVTCQKTALVVTGSLDPGIIYIFRTGDSAT
jgi:hypothetical protein